MNFLHIMAGIVAVLMFLLGLGLVCFGMHRRNRDDDYMLIFGVIGIIVMLVSLLPAWIASS